MLAFSGGRIRLTNVTVAYNAVAQGTGGAAGTGGKAGVAGSVGAGQGGGIFNYPSSNLLLTNTLVASNKAASAPDYFGSVNSSDHNLIGNSSGSSGFSAAHGDLLNVAALIGTLGNHGGVTQTILLMTGSPAIDAGDNAATLLTGLYDQRGPGFPRVINGGKGNIIDIGATEF